MSTTAPVTKPEKAPSFDGEVVTDVKVRVLDLPGGAGRCALLTMDNGFDHTKPNVFGPAPSGRWTTRWTRPTAPRAWWPWRSRASRSSSTSVRTSRASRR